MVVDLKKHAEPRCGNCKHATPRDGGDPEKKGYLCRRFPPQVQLVPLCPAVILPYVLEIAPAPAALKEAVAEFKGLPVFYPLVNFPGVAGGDVCGEHTPALMRAMN